MLYDAFELCCCRRLLRVPWIARRSNQPILKVISPEYSLEQLMLKLKLQYFGYLMQRTDSLEKTLMLGKIEGGRSREPTEDEMVGWHHWLSGHEFKQGLGVGDGQGSLVCCSPWDYKELDMTEQLNCLLVYVCVHTKSVQSCPILCNSFLGSRLFCPWNSPGRHAGVGWVAMPCFRGSSRPRDPTGISYISCIVGKFFTSETQRKPMLAYMHTYFTLCY